MDVDIKDGLPVTQEVTYDYPADIPDHSLMDKDIEPFDAHELARAVRREDTNRRMQENPEKTGVEVKMGCYVEELEPQVRGAVVDLNEKGYETSSSGFNGDTEQIIEMPPRQINFTPELKQSLSELGVTVIDGISSVPGDTESYNQSLLFRPETANLKAIENKWSQITSLIPHK